MPRSRGSGEGTGAGAGGRGGGGSWAVADLLAEMLSPTGGNNRSGGGGGGITSSSGRGKKAAADDASASRAFGGGSGFTKRLESGEGLSGRSRISFRGSEPAPSNALGDGDRGDGKKRRVDRDQGDRLEQQQQQQQRGPNTAGTHHGW